MPSARPRAGSPIAQYFQYSVLGMCACGFVALAGARPLDWPTLALMFAALAVRALKIAGVVRFEIRPIIIALAAGACAAFFAVDYYLLSRDFFTATLHGVCFLTAVKIVTARVPRDYLYTGAVAFIQLAAAAMLSLHAGFFLWLALYLVFTIAALTSAEVQSGYSRNAQVVRAPDGHVRWRLTAVACVAGLAILLVTGGLFLAVPRTARAAAMLFPNAPRMTGFSNVVDLGAIGGIAKDTRPVMHILSYNHMLPPGLKWRGAALTWFDGRRWSEPPAPELDIPHHGTMEVAGPLQRSRRDARRLLYRVDMNGTDTGTLFIAGIPEFINVSTPRLVREGEDSFRARPATGEPIQYEVSAHPGPALPTEAGLARRALYLQLPPVDGRVRSLARDWARQGDPMQSALRIERHLRQDFEYSLDGPRRAAADPVADFLFVDKRGYCEYFASAMAVMLRTLGIPSRVATGFQSGYYNDVSGLYVVRASDAHAWVEAWIDGRGWITFDPTPSGPAPGTSLMSHFGMYLDAADSAWQRWVVAYDPDRQAALASNLARDIRWMGNTPAPAMPWRRLFSARAIGWYGAALLLVLLAWAAVRTSPRALTAWKRRAQFQRIANRRGVISDGRDLYEHMLRSVERRGYRKPQWFTPLEFARTLPPYERERVARFTTAYNSVRFGGNVAGVTELAQMLKDFGDR